MSEVNLLRALPLSKRNVTARATAKTPEHRRISREFGEMYFDGPREYGYGGYHNDGRWKPVASDIISHFGLVPGSRVLDIGCAKGFLVSDLVNQGIDAYGIDVSQYAVSCGESQIQGRLCVASADHIPFPDHSFDAVLSINTAHNLPYLQCMASLREMERLAPGKGFIQVDSYRTQAEKELCESWILTALYHDFPHGWRKLFDDAGYTGDWYWTIIN